MPEGLTVVAPVRAGAEERLRGALRPIGDDIRGTRLQGAGPRPHIDFCGSRNLHFARFALLDDPERGPGRTRLLFSSNYDGDLDLHLRELVAATSDLDAVWGCCEGFTGAARFGDFIRAHQCQAEAFYIAFRGESAARIREYAALRRRSQSLLDEAAGSRTPVRAILADVFSKEASSGAALPVPESPLERVLIRLRRALPLGADVVRAIVRCGFMNTFLGARKVTASLDRYLLLRWFNRLTRNPPPPSAPIHSSAALDTCAVQAPVTPGDEFPSPRHETPPSFREDVVAQNQLTVVTVVRPGQTARVRAVMAAIDAYARRLSPDGSLVGVSTIHFVRWVLLDEGRRLVLLSDYDGSWEAYIDEFAETILSGLDAIWETSFGYPPDGARDVPAFKQFLRNHQVPAEIFYSAYPDETVLNILGDRAFARACADAAGGRTDTLPHQL